MATLSDVFVYGTLKRDQCRGNLWPCLPLKVVTAFVRGRLFDLGPYPALRCDDEDADSDWVQGELWSFSPADVSATVAALDQIEETNQPGVKNLYDRVLVRAHRSPGSQQSTLALAYQYSTAASLPASRRVLSSGRRGWVAWPVVPAP